MDFDQGTFNFDADGDGLGYQKWQQELDARKKQFERRYGIILGSTVRLTLRGEDKPVEGILTLCDSKQPKNRAQLHLRIASRIITVAEIQSISRI